MPIGKNQNPYNAASPAPARAKPKARRRRWPTVRPGAGPHAPGDPHGPQAVGQVVDRGQDADRIDGPHPRCLLHGFDACRDGIVVIEKPASQLARHVFQPPLRVVDPAARLKNVPEDEGKGDDPVQRRSV